MRGTKLMFVPIAVIQLGQPETLQAAAGKRPPGWKTSPKAGSSRNRQHDHGRDPLVLIRLHDPAASPVAAAARTANVNAIPVRRGRPPFRKGSLAFREHKRQARRNAGAYDSEDAAPK